MLRLVRAFALLAALAAVPQTAVASPVDLFGYGARGSALTGAVVSTARGHEAVYYNPAGLGLDTFTTVSIAFQMGHFDLAINGQDRKVRDAPAFVIGFGVPIPFGGVMKDRLALGLAFVIPQTSVLIADIPRPGQPSFTVVENRAQTVSIQGALGIRIVDQLSVGIGFLALSALDGSIDVAPNETGKLGSTVKDVLVASYSMVVGAIVRPIPELAVGLTYRMESRADFEIPMTVDLGEQFPIPVPMLDVSGTAQYDPAQIAFEVSGEPLPFLTLSLAGVYKFWSEFDNPLVYTAVPEDYPPQPEPGFSDTFSIRFGAEARVVVADPDWTLTPRLGFAFEPTPAPEQKGFHNYLDTDRTVLGFGLAVAYKSLRLDLTGQWHHLPERTSAKDPGLVNEEDDNPGFPSISYGGNIFFWAVELGLRL